MVRTHDFTGLGVLICFLCSCTRKYKYNNLGERTMNHPNKKNFLGHSQHMLNNPEAGSEFTRHEFRTTYGKNFKDRNYRKVKPAKDLSMTLIINEASKKNQPLFDAMTSTQQYILEKRRGFSETMRNPYRTATPEQYRKGDEFDRSGSIGKGR